MRIKRLHFISGVTISIFIALHLLNHLSSIFGMEYHIDLMDRLRLIYRNVWIETILLLAVLIQIFSGIKLFLSTRKKGVGFYRKLQIWSGLYLAFFLIIHVTAVLVGRYILDLDTNFYFGVAGLNTFPFNLFFIPYYSVAIIAFFGHVAAIHAQKMKKSIFGISVNHQSMIILCIGIFVSILVLYGLTNGFAGVEIPEEYNIMIGK